MNDPLDEKLRRRIEEQGVEIYGGNKQTEICVVINIDDNQFVNYVKEQHGEFYYNYVLEQYCNVTKSVLLELPSSF